MKIKYLLSLYLILSSFLFANEFIDYKQMAGKLYKENKKNNNIASIEDVKKALKDKTWLVADVRKMDEWAAARIKGTVRIGRQSPEKALENFVLDEDDNFIKPNLIVICNSGKRASVEAEIFRKMGFKQVKVFDLYTWIDSCNPIINNYSSKKNKKGNKKKFGSFKAEYCKK